MPWTCPACGDRIQHSDGEEVPTEGALYRCYVCRLELIVDPQRKKLIVESHGGAAEPELSRRSTGEMPFSQHAD
jgi:hypothetical protein